jgi:aldehyde dehydrogenase family 7 protein A1
MPDADLDLAVPAVFFGAVGTAGQRCTSTRRLYLHRTIAPDFLARLQKLYSALQPGDPLDPHTLLGPLHTHAAADAYDRSIAELQAADAHILIGGARYTEPAGGNFVRPTIVRPPLLPSSSPSHGASLWETERFAPVLLVAEFEELEQAIVWNNAVPQGLSSSLWTRDVRNVGKWIGPAGSDAGIVNVRFRVPYPHHPLFLLPTSAYYRSTLGQVERRLAPLLEGTRFGI